MKTSSRSLWAKYRHILTVTTAAILLTCSARATGSTTVVISQVYGGGGNSGATYQNDFVELFNKSGSPVSLNGWSVQYASATGTFGVNDVNLPNVTLQPGQYYLIQMASQAAVGAVLPTPDFSSTGINMSGTAGKVALANTTTGLGSVSSLPDVRIVDFVGFGSTASIGEGGTKAPAPSNTTSVQRGNSGCTDTDNNSTDFTAVTPVPRNTATPTHSCGAGTPTQIRVETANDGSGTVVSAQNVAAGSSLTVYAVARDASANFVTATNGTWALLSKTGGVVDGDLVAAGGNASAVLTGHIVGSAIIDVATAGLTSVDSGVVTVTNGTPTQLTIETQANGNGTLIGSQTLPTGNSLVARSIRRDTYGNFVDNVAADSWSLTSLSGSVVSGDLVPDGALKFATMTGNGTGSAVIHVVSGALTTNSGTITVAGVAPTITAPPPSYTTNASVNVTFFVSVSGSTPLTYQWKKNGNDISGKTDSTLVLTGIANTDSGSYTVGVTNAFGGTVSAAGTLTINVNAFTLMTYNVKGNFSADWDINHPQVQALERQLLYLQPDIITFNEIPNGSNATLIAIIANTLPGYYSTGTSAATDGGIRSAVVSRWPIIASNSFFHNLDLTPYGAAGQTYTRDLYVAKIQVPGMSKPLNVATSHLKSNGTQPDSCIRRAGEANVVSNFFYNFRQTNTDFYVMTGDWNQDIVNNDACDPTNKPADSITASNFTGLFLTTPRDPNAPGATTNFFTHTIQGTFAHRYDYIVPCGTLYSNVASSKVFRTSTLPSLIGTGLNANDDATTSDHLPVLMSFNNPDTSSPTIAIAPANQTNLATTTAIFSVVAGGASPLSYQWHKGNANLVNGPSPSGSGATITGSTTAALTITGVLSADADSYSVTITNSIGSTNSTPVTLTIIDPAILTNPNHQTNGIGATVSFSATAGGTAPVTYQWQHAGTNLSNGGTITGATSTTLSISGIVTNDGGSYTFIANNTFGAVTSSFARLVVTVPASITPDPTGQTVNAGGTILLSATAAGSPNPNTHWERNGVTITNCSACSAAGTGISGATGGNLKITNAIAGDAGSYTFVASNSTAVVTSAVAIVVVNDPFITTQPADTGGALGGSAVFKVVAAGTAPITYHWQKNGGNLSDTGNISGSTTTNLTVSSISTGDLGSYRVLVTGASGTLTSSSAQLIVTAAGGEVLLSTASYSQNFDSIGTSATASLPPGWVMSFTGTSTPSNSTPGNFFATSQAGAGASTTGGRYNWNDGTTTTDHSIGFLTSGGYANPNSIMLGLYNNTGSNITDLALTFNYKQYRTNTSAASLSFFYSIDGFTWISIPGGDASISGGTAGQANPANVTSKSASINGMNLPVASKFYLRWNFNTGASSSQGIGLDDFTWVATLAPPSAVPPTITSQPVAGTVWQGTNITLTVGANGDLPLAYQWYKNNVLLTDKTNASLALTSVTPANNGSYTCVVTNDANTVTSAAAVLVVQTPTVATIAQLRALLDTTTWIPTDTTTIYQVTGTVTTFTNTVTGNNTLFAIQDNTAGVWAFLSGSNMTVNAGDVVQVTAPVADFQGRLELSAVASNPTHSVIITGSASVPSPALLALSSQTDNPTMESLEGSRIVISNILMDLRTNTFTTNSLLTVTNAANLAETFQMRIDAHSADFQGQSKPTGPVAIIGTLDQSTTNAARTNNYRIVPTRYIDVLQPPSITVQPTSVTVECGSSGVLNVTATGPGSLSYQWYTPDANGTAVSGGNTSSLTVNNVHGATPYVVVVTDSYGSSTSGSASITAVDTTAPVITVNAGPSTTCLGSGYSDPGATANDACQGSVGVSTSGSVNTGVAGSYTLTYSASDTSLNNSTATRVVSVVSCADPRITVQPANVVAATGSNVVFSITAVGTGPLKYQWFFIKNGTTTPKKMVHSAVIPAVTNDTLSINKVSGAANGGSYYCVVSNALHSVATSANATLTVHDAPVVKIIPPFKTLLAGYNFKLVAKVTKGALGQTVSYQWKKNGTSIGGANTSTYSLVNVQTNDGAIYTCVVNNDSPTAGSNSCPLTVTQDIDVPKVVLLLKPSDGSAKPAYKPGDAIVKDATGTNVAPTVDFIGEAVDKGLIVSALVSNAANQATFPVTFVQKPTSLLATNPSAGKPAFFLSQVTLVGGTNIFYGIATDSDGNTTVSAHGTHLFYNSDPQTLTLTTAGTGHVLSVLDATSKNWGNPTNTAVLTYGHNYTIKATATGHLVTFGQWVLNDPSALISTNATSATINSLTFQMKTNLSITAKFSNAP